MRARIYIRTQAGASIHFGHSSIIIWSTVRESKDTHQHPKSSRFRVLNPELRYAGPSVSRGKEAVWHPSAAMLTFLFFLHFSAQPPQWVLHLSYLNLSTIFTFSLSPIKLFFSCHIYQPDYFSSNLLQLVFWTVPSSVLIMPISSPYPFTGTPQWSCQFTTNMARDRAPAGVWPSWLQPSGCWPLPCLALSSLASTLQVTDGPTANSHGIHSTCEWLQVVLRPEILDPWPVHFVIKWRCSRLQSFDLCWW